MAAEDGLYLESFLYLHHLQYLHTAAQMQCSSRV